ncbi:MAG: hypothetical protein RL648_408, partial [Verrucomicrobiota bacterium]
MKGLLFFCISCALLMGGLPRLVAQSSQPIVADIEIEFADIRNVSDEAILARLQIREGAAFDQTLVDRSIRSLYATRLFDFIEARTEDLPGGQ